MTDNSSPPPESATVSGHASFNEILAAYLAAFEAGERPNREALLTQHPQLADELREFFANHDQMNRFARPLCEPTSAPLTGVTAERIRYFGDYEVLEEIARGGMGVVFKARQVSLSRIVAVKLILSGQHASPADIERFQTEAKAAASLQHPHIVPIHEVGQHEGLHYFSMDFVEGRSLSAILQENVLSAKQAASYVRQMAEAIHYAHQQGTLHRDLKPSNVLIDSRDQVRITDFGLAMRVEGNSALTQTGQIVGTPSYMPPEQAQGKRSLIGPGSDVYSLGAILYECLTGRAPFRADSVMKTIEQVIHVEAASPRLLNPGVDRDLETICLKCLEKEPHRRYGTAQLLADDLGRFLRGEPIAARPISRPARLGRWCKRSPVVASLMVLFLASLVSGTAFSSFFAWRSNQWAKDAAVQAQAAIDNAVLAKNETERANEHAQAANAMAKKEANASRKAVHQEALAVREAAEARRIQKEFEQVVGSLGEVNAALAQGKQQLDRTQVRLAGASLRGHRPIDAMQYLDACSAEGQTYEWRLYRKWAKPLLAEVENATCAAFSLDGKWLAIGEDRIEGEASLRIEEFATGKILYRLELKAIPCRVMFSPNANYVAFIARNAPIGTGLTTATDLQTYVWHPQSQQLHALGKSFSMTFDPTSEQLMTTCTSCVRSSPPQGEVLLWKLAADVAPVSERQIELEGLRIVSANAAWVATIADAEIKVVGLAAEDKHTLKVASPQVEGIRELRGWTEFAFSQDGRFLAATRFGTLVNPQYGHRGFSQLVVWDVAAAAVQHNLFLRDLTFSSITFSPDGSKLACGTILGSPRRQTDAKPVFGVHIWNLTLGELERVLPWHSKEVASLSFSTDGRWLLACEHGLLKIWELTPVTQASVLNRGGGEAVHAAGHGQAVYAVAISGDGRRVASSTTGRTSGVCVWDTDNGILSFELPENGNCSRLEFSRDDRYLASAGDKLIVWELQTRRPVLELDGKATCVEFSPDGNRLATTRKSQTEIYDLATSSLLATYQSGNTYCTAFHPNDQLLAVSGSGGSQVWDMKTGTKFWGFDEKTYRSTFTPSGDLVALGFGTKFGRVELRKTSSGELVRTWSTGTGAEFVLDIRFTPDGGLLATTNIAEIGLWDPQTSQKALALTHPDIAASQVESGNRSYAVAFSRDGARAVAGWSHKKGNGSITVWDTAIGRESISYRWLARDGGLDPPVLPIQSPPTPPQAGSLMK